MDDVLEMAEMLLRTRNTDALALVQTVEALAAEVRELRKDRDAMRARLLSVASGEVRVYCGNVRRRELVEKLIRHDNTPDGIIAAIDEAMAMSFDDAMASRGEEK